MEKKTKINSFFKNKKNTLLILLILVFIVVSIVYFQFQKKTQNLSKKILVTFTSSVPNTVFVLDEIDKQNTFTTPTSIELLPQKYTVESKAEGYPNKITEINVDDKTRVFDITPNKDVVEPYWLKIITTPNPNSFTWFENQVLYQTNDRILRSSDNAVLLNIEPTSQITWSQNGQALIVSSKSMVMFSYPTTLKMLSTTGQLGSVSPDGTKAVIVDNNQIKIINTTTEELLFEQKVESKDIELPITNVFWSANQDFIVISATNRNALVFQISTKKQTLLVGVKDVIFFDQNNYFITNTNNNLVHYVNNKPVFLNTKQNLTDIRLLVSNNDVVLIEKHIDAFGRELDTISTINPETNEITPLTVSASLVNRIDTQSNIFSSTDNFIIIVPEKNSTLWILADKENIKKMPGFRDSPEHLEAP